jgi:CRISPR-associated endonuclease/helicase Cas3
VRVAPGLIGAVPGAALADVLAKAMTPDRDATRAALRTLALPAPIREDLDALESRARGQGRKRIIVHLDLYGLDPEGRPRGVVLVAPRGLDTGDETEEGQPNATEDNASGSLPGFPEALDKHCKAVAEKAAAFAAAAGLPDDRVADLRLAGFLHDAGKADPRFQAWLHHDDPLGPDLDESASILAKSGRPLPLAARAMAGLPPRWRHEALSVRLAERAADFAAEVHDPELVLWLIGTHHGHGRPFFPHDDREEDRRDRSFPAVLGLPTSLPAGHGPQSLAYDRGGLDWPGLFDRLKARYGIWELARLEAVLRLADHRASQDATEKAE